MTNRCDQSRKGERGRAALHRRKMDIGAMANDLTVATRMTRREQGRVLLDLLTERFPYHDRWQWQRALDAGHLLLNGAPARADQQLSRGDLLVYHAADYVEPVVPEQIEEVLATPDLLLVGKPADAPLQRTGQVIANTFVNQLRRHYGEDIYPLHRLDRETSGLLLCARGREANRRYQRRREQIITGKYYLAIVKGDFGERAVTVEQPLAFRQDSAIRCRVWPDAAGKPCCTRLQRIAAAEDLSLLLVELVTGRRHQIRAHLAHLGHPLLGDKIYDQDGRFYLKRLEAPLTEQDFRQLGARHHLLHAWALHLQLPGETQARTRFSRLFSADFQDCLDRFPGWEERARQLLPRSYQLLGKSPFPPEDPISTGR